MLNKISLCSIQAERWHFVVLNNLFDVFFGGIIYLDGKYLGIAILFKLARWYITRCVISYFLSTGSSFFIRVMKTLLRFKCIITGISHNSCNKSTFLGNNTTHLGITLIISIWSSRCFVIVLDWFISYLSINFCILPRNYGVLLIYWTTSLVIYDFKVNWRMRISMVLANHVVAAKKGGVLFRLR